MPRDCMSTSQRIAEDFSISLDKVFSHNGGTSMINWDEARKSFVEIEKIPCLFSEIFLKLLDDNNLKPRDFIDLSGIPAMTVYQWTWGSKCTDPNHLLKLCVIFDVSYDYLFFGKGLDPSEKTKMLQEKEARIMKLEQELWLKEEELKNQMELFDAEKNKEILSKNMEEITNGYFDQKTREGQRAS